MSEDNSIIEKITEETELDEEEVKEKVEDKLDEFSGLVSEEGALHLVAKEHGVQIAEAQNKDLKINNIVPEMRKVNFKARVANISDINTFERDEEDEEGKVQNMTLGDDTETIRMTLWDEQTQITEKINEGDAIEISGAYTVEDQQENAEIRLGDNATVKMADEDEVPEIKQNTQSTATEATIKEIQTENSQFQTTGMIMALYTSSPFYKVDPETGDTVRENDDGELVTDDGKEVENPDHRLALSGVIDDGTDNIRCVFFGEQARKILEIDEETEKEGDLKKVEEQVNQAIGKEIQVKGNTRHNDYFSQLELLVNQVEELETQKQIEKLLEQLEA